MHRRILTVGSHESTMSDNKKLHVRVILFCCIVKLVTLIGLTWPFVCWKSAICANRSDRLNKFHA